MFVSSRQTGYGSLCSTGDTPKALLLLIIIIMRINIISLLKLTARPRLLSKQPATHATLQHLPVAPSAGPLFMDRHNTNGYQ